MVPFLAWFGPLFGPTFQYVTLLDPQVMHPGVTVFVQITLDLQVERTP